MSKILWNRVKIFSLKQFHGVKGFCKTVNWKRSISESKPGGSNILAAQICEATSGLKQRFPQWYQFHPAPRPPPVAQRTSLIPRSGQITESHTVSSLICYTPRHFSLFKWGYMKTAVLYPKESGNERVLPTATSWQVTAGRTSSTVPEPDQKPNGSAAVPMPGWPRRPPHTRTISPLPDSVLCLTSPFPPYQLQILCGFQHPSLIVRKCNNGDMK